MEVEIHMTRVEYQSRRHFIVLTGTGLVGLLSGCAKKNSDDDESGRWGSGSSSGEGGTGSTSSGGTEGGGTEGGGTEGGGTESGGTETGGAETGLVDDGSTTDTGSEGGDTGMSTGGGTEDTGSPEGEVPPETCDATDDDIEGPFYRSDAPVRSDLDLYGDPGTVFLLSGFVLDRDCNPIADAVVEIWHADPTAVPVDELTSTDSVDYDNSSAEMRYRGQIGTDADGRYAFRTKKPGWYLNGPRFRPMHFHMKVWVGGVERLTTQLYFEGDPYIEGDAWASLDRALAVVTEGVGVESARFDFTLDV